MNAWPSRFDNHSAISRAKMSVGPPGGNPTMMRTGRVDNRERAPYLIRSEAQRLPAAQKIACGKAPCDARELECLPRHNSKHSKARPRSAAGTKQAFNAIKQCLLSG